MYSEHYNMLTVGNDRVHTLEVTIIALAESIGSLLMTMTYLASGWISTPC